MDETLQNESQPEAPTGPEPTFVDWDEPADTAEAPVAEETPAPPAAPEAPKAIPYDRFAEVASDRDRLREQNDHLMRLALRDQATPPAPPRGPVGSDIDPDVRALIEPIIDARLQGLEPLLAEREREIQLDQAEELMPGFRAQWWDKVQAEYAKLPESAKPHFNHPVGAVALAGIIRDREESEKRVSKEPLKKRAHSEAVPNPPRKAPTLSPNDIERMSSEEFNRFVEAQKGNGRLNGGERFLR